MIADFGYVLLIVALIASLAQALSPFLTFLSPPKFPKFIASVIFFSLITSFFCLMYSYVVSDFSLLNVYKNSHTAKPLIFKITGTWGNHEGSMLLFITLLSFIGFLFAAFGEIDIKKRVLSFQGAILFFLITYVFFTSNPFDRIYPVPLDGQGLNPLLQDIGLAMHPPMLYLGYVGFSLALSFSLAGLLEGKVDRKWAVALKPWVIASWSFLTLGIGLGSWWAYRELGWGGFWFWDPVENSSLLPWLSATALLHCLLVLEKRNILKAWTVFLAIITFSLSLVGFFLVRSGVLTSVHAFASDPYRGVFMLILIAIIVGYSFVLYAVKVQKLKDGADFEPVSKESAILFNNLLLTTLCATVFLGTMYPIFLEVVASDRVSVGTPYFNAVFMPIALILLFLAAIGPLLKWKKDSLLSLVGKFGFSFLFAIVLVIAASYREGAVNVTSVALGLSGWLFMVSFMEFADRVKLFKSNFGEVAKKARSLPLGFYAMTVSHIGVAVIAASITMLSAWQDEKELLMKDGDKVEIGSYNIEFLGTKLKKGKNFLARIGEFSINEGGAEIAKLYPESRVYFVSGTDTKEADVYYTMFSDLYIVMGDTVLSSTGEGGNGFSIRIFVKPFMSSVWLGCILIALGGFISLYGRVFDKK